MGEAGRLQESICLPGPCMVVRLELYLRFWATELETGICIRFSAGIEGRMLIRVKGQWGCSGSRRDAKGNGVKECRTARRNAAG